MVKWLILNLSWSYTKQTLQSTCNLLETCALQSWSLILATLFEATPHRDRMDGPSFVGTTQIPDFKRARFYMLHESLTLKFPIFLPTELHTLTVCSSLHVGGLYRADTSKNLARVTDPVCRTRNESTVGHCYTDDYVPDIGGIITQRTTIQISLMYFIASGSWDSLEDNTAGHVTQHCGFICTVWWRTRHCLSGLDRLKTLTARMPTSAEWRDGLNLVFSLRLVNSAKSFTRLE